MVNNIFKKISSLISLFYRGYGFYKWQIVTLAALGLVGGLLEGVGVNAVIPLFSFLTGATNHGTDPISRFIEFFFNFVGIKFSLRYLLIFILVLFALRTVVILVNYYIKIKITTDYSEKMRNRLFGRVLQADWPHLLNQKLGHLNTLLITNIEYGEALLGNLSATIMILSSLLMYIVVAVNISLPITIITILLGGLVFIFFKPLLNKTRFVSGKIEKLNRDISHFVNENVLGLKTIKATLSELPVVEKGKYFFRELKNARAKVFLFGVIPDTTMPLIGLVFVIAIFAYSYKMPNFNLAALAVVVYLINRIFVYIQQLQGQFQAISGYAPYLESVLKYEDEAILSREINDGIAPVSFGDSLSFKNIGFKYENGAEILNNLNFTVKQGEMVGIIGPSGSGKTTIVDLILRLLKPTSGEILSDGKNISLTDLNAWRGMIGYVSQDIFLINDTIANNIRFYNSTLTEKEIEDASKMANIFDFINILPKKFETSIGERGLMISAGQRQRIIIARVLARKPKLLILDEATSALDNKSELEIQFVIDGLKGKTTVIVIAHRLSTVLNADKLIAINKGKVIETGSPADLLKNENSYFSTINNIKK